MTCAPLHRSPRRYSRHYAPSTKCTGKVFDVTRRDKAAPGSHSVAPLGVSSNQATRRRSGVFVKAGGRRSSPAALDSLTNLPSGPPDRDKIGVAGERSRGPGLVTSIAAAGVGRTGRVRG